ncbi:MAG: hypothetical protein ACP6IQ_10470 [Candidatus Njordarchaeia archaeon]
MRFIVDECMSILFFELLKKENLNVIFVGNCCRGATDFMILNKANIEERILPLGFYQGTELK